MLSESSTGYICALEPYFGKVTTYRMEQQDIDVTSILVLHLVNKLKHLYGNVEGLHVFTDCFYTNFDLAGALYDMKVHLTDTIMRSRNALTEQVQPARNISRKSKDNLQLKKGEVKTYINDDKYFLLSWKDSNDVTMITTLNSKLYKQLGV